VTTLELRTLVNAGHCAADNRTRRRGLREETRFLLGSCVRLRSAVPFLFLSRLLSFATRLPCLDPFLDRGIALGGCLIGPSLARRSGEGLTCASDVDGQVTSARTTHGAGPNPGPAGGRAVVH
jgi:hypothetical protein